MVRVQRNDTELLCGDGDGANLVYAGGLRQGSGQSTPPVLGVGFARCSIAELANCIPFACIPLCFIASSPRFRGGSVDSRFCFR